MQTELKFISYSTFPDVAKEKKKNFMVFLLLDDLKKKEFPSKISPAECSSMSSLRT